MKKTLIALAALSAISGSAVAQSSVTVSGRLDQGYSTKTTNAASAGDVQTKSIVASPLATSFLRLSGTEDLGGGLKASFLMESGMSGAATTLGDRGLFLDLDGGFGSLRVGNQPTVERLIWTGFSQTGAMNVVGDLNSSTPEDAGGTGTHVTFEKAVKYTTPSFKGLTASAALNVATTDTSGVKSGSDGTSFAVAYNQGKFKAMAGMSKLTTQAASTAAVAAVSAQYFITTTGLVTTTETANNLLRAAVASSASAAAYEVETDTTSISASYDFGFATAAVTHFDIDTKRSNTRTTGAVDRKSTTLGVSAPVGKAVVFGTYGFGKQETAGNGYKGDLSGMQIGVRYNLSKRTAAYLATGKVEHELSTSTKNENKETALGLVHLF
jgi:predicted porin